MLLLVGGPRTRGNFSRRFKTCHAHQSSAQVNGTILGTARAPDVAWRAVEPHWGHRTHMSPLSEPFEPAETSVYGLV